jgi:hypothetical protein
MRSDELTTEQAELLRDALARHVRLLDRLMDRMNQRGFPTDDPVFIAAIRAQNAMYGLLMAVHYAGCKSGVGKPGR